MNHSLLKKLEILSLRYAELKRLLADPHTLQDQNYYRDLSKEYASLEPIVKCFEAYQTKQHAIDAATEWLAAEDTDLKEMAKEEIATLGSQQTALESELKTLLLPQDPNDDKNVFLEIRAGTGGHEAALFSGDLFRMYNRFAERQGWEMHVVSAHEGEQGGFKEIILRIDGQRVYSQLKFESGVHRVQRVPVTEAQGRIHTSACTVAVLPEADEVEAIAIDPSVLRIDTYRASGAGGQHVNKTDSAVRITHVPTGTVVECQDERSQHKNKARAMALLRARLLSHEQEKQERERSEARKMLVGSGDRSERIRTYNFPQGRLTDHRIQLTLYQLDKVMEGELALVIAPLLQELKAKQLIESDFES